MNKTFVLAIVRESSRHTPCAVALAGRHFAACAPVGATDGTPANGTRSVPATPHRPPRERLLVLALATLGLLSTLPAAAQQDNSVVVTPEETDEILANPGMGWETFHVAAKDDKNLPNWIPSTIYYVRWGWNDLEPEQGKLNTKLLDDTLKEAHDSGQTVAFRVGCCSTRPNDPAYPSWLTDIGGRVLRARYNRNAPVLIPDLDDPIVLQRHLDLIKRLGQRYDGHPDLDHVDIGSIGWFGEWHLTSSGHSLMPTVETRKKVIDAYLAAFKKTPRLMLIGGGECLSYAVQRGAGWRADCLGDMGGFSKTWSHMRQAYPSAVVLPNVQDAWKTAPVAWETCWDMRKWVAEGWSVRYIFNYALALHGSYINNKSAPLPDGPDIRPEVERFLRRLGYRLVLKELKHAASVKPGEKLELSMKWQNTGSAPCYRPYRLAYRLSNDRGAAKVMVSTVTVNHWLPGSIELFTAEFFKDPADLPPGEVVPISDNVVLPADLAPGQYVLSIAVVGQDEKPVVRLAIKGRADDGWYPLSKVTVKK
jgi:hypothetical protein